MNKENPETPAPEISPEPQNLPLFPVDDLDAPWNSGEGAEYQFGIEGDEDYKDFLWGKIFRLSGDLEHLEDAVEFFQEPQGIPELEDRVMELISEWEEKAEGLET